MNLPWANRALGLAELGLMHLKAVLEWIQYPTMPIPA